MNVILLIYKKVVAFLPEHHHNLFSFTMINIWLLLCHLNNPISKVKFKNEVFIVRLQVGHRTLEMVSHTSTSLEPLLYYIFSR